jgi:ribosomal-protein-alanine N-acetyltransferase
MLSLETDRLTLRRFTLDDLDSLARLWSDPEVTRYLPGGQPFPPERSERGLRFFMNHWESHGFGTWAVVLKAEPENFVGYSGIQYVLDGSAVELLYGLARPYWGQGYGFEAAQASLNYGFETAGLDQLIAVVFPGNTASRRIIEKLGFLPASGFQPYGPEVLYYTLDRQEYVKAA